MRILTTIAGVIISLVGAGCFAVYLHPFGDVAFVIGTAMIIAGILLTLGYIISGKGETKLTDVALVEGLATFFYGFSVVNGQVSEQTLTLFFGTWLTLAGFTRISQSLYVSRINPRDWAKIMPLAMVAATIGVIMMMPSTLQLVYPLLLVGGVFLLNGFSIIIYAMYMKRTDVEVSQSEQSARERAEARKALAKERRERRDALRNMSKEERYAAQAQIRQERKEREAEKKREKDARKQARKDAAAAAAGSTIVLSKEEIDEIVSNAPQEQLEEDARNEEEVKLAAKSGRKRSRIIPKISFSRGDEDIKKKKEDDGLILRAVNLAELEAEPELEFEKVELPEPELAIEKEEEVVDREEVIHQIEEVELPEFENVDYTPLFFDDEEEATVEEPKEDTKKKDKKDKKESGKNKDNEKSGKDLRFSQRLIFRWKEADNSED